MTQVSHNLYKIIIYIQYIFQYLKNIGYCPQFDALNMQLSTKEMLTFFARIRGIKSEKLHGHVNHWLKRFGKFVIIKFAPCLCFTVYLKTSHPSCRLINKIKFYL